HEARIYENTSWSCAHGVERWRSDCGCNTGGHPGWNQAWRVPLRAALDWLRDAVAPMYEQRASEFLKDPWAARNDYISVILDRSPESVWRFFEQHAARPLDHEETVIALKLLEMQRHAMLMFTGCGWFFDELSGIETVQVIQYAGRVVQLAQEIFGDSVEQGFLERLAKARSNIPEHGDGRAIYEKWVKPSMIDLITVTAHYAISSLFEQYEDETRVYSYVIQREDYQTDEAGRMRLALGRVRTTSEITGETNVVSFGVLHFGDHTIHAGVRQYRSEDEYQQMISETRRAFEVADFTEVIRGLNRHFGETTYTLRALFSDEQRKVLGYILESIVADAEAAFRRVYEQNYPLMRFVADLGRPLPQPFQDAADTVINTDLRKSVSSAMLANEPAVVKGLLQDARLWNVKIDAPGLALQFAKELDSMMADFAAEPESVEKLEGLNNALSVVSAVPFQPDFWRAQNLYYGIMQTTYPQFQERAQRGDQKAREWVNLFVSLGERLSIKVPLNTLALL
ncbi:MAG: DUF3536 domain-containing protein, partial [Chloroflexi bacterium]|nr:DUF3536 domain-containing protein [Chloroflexota bacterium]